MAYIVGEPCFNCKYGDCVEVCPVECFYQDEKTLVINPDECIDCDACVPECPVDAIFSEDDSPGYDESKCEHDAQYWIDYNKNFEYEGKDPVISKEDVVHGPDWDESTAKG